jgi:hypothetical protein
MGFSYGYFRMRRERPPLVTVALTSAAALAYELLLMRLLAVVQWHHLAFLVISLALLGYGASGSWLVLSPGAYRQGYDRFFHLSSVALPLSMWCSTEAGIQVPFNPLDIRWNAFQLVYLLLAIVLFAVPFFFAGVIIGSTLKRFDHDIPRIYGSDLAGAGIGAIGMVALLYRADPLDALAGVVGLAVCAAISAGVERPSRLGTATAVTAVLAAFLAAGTSDRSLALRLSPYKPLRQTLEIPEAKIIEDRSSPLGWVAVVDSPTIPFRMVQGASLLSTIEPPAQLAVFTDGDQPDPITRFEGDRGSLAYLDQTSTALAFHLMPSKGSALLPMAGMGSTVLLSFFHGRSPIDALQLDPQKIDLLTERFSALSGWPYLSSHTRLIPKEIRGFLAGNAAPYDLILFPAIGSGSGPGSLALTEDYHLTVDAFRSCLRALSPGGCLSVSWQLRLPPRDGLRLVDTVLTAMREEGITRPADHLAVVRSWKTGTLLIREGGITPEDRIRIRSFCRERGFDPVYFPGISVREVNRRNILRRPEFFEGVTALIGEDRDRFLTHYPYDVEAVTDDRPYFHFFHKSPSLGDWMPGAGQDSVGMTDWGAQTIFLTLTAAILLGTVLIFLPLLAKRRLLGGPGPGRCRLMVYFGGIGFGFIALEIVFIQMGVRFLHHPVLAASSVLAGVLVFAGVGSRLVARLAVERINGVRVELWVAGGVALGSVIALGVFGIAGDRLMEAPLGYRIAAVALSTGPVAFFIGMFFPIGMMRLTRTRPDRMPWAWAVNGCSSVIGAVLAAMLSLHLGYLRLTLAAIALYGLSALVGPISRPSGLKKFPGPPIS